MERHSITNRVAELQREYELTKRLYTSAKSDHVQAEKDLKSISQAHAVCIELERDIQGKAHKKLTGIVTSCLQSIIGSDYRFDIKFIKIRGRTEAKPVLIDVRSDIEIVDPVNEDSGGVVDIVSFALRVCDILLTKPEVDRILVLDEPFRFVSKKHRPAVRELLENVSESFDMQIILVTHQEEYITGKVIRLENINGKTCLAKE